MKFKKLSIKNLNEIIYTRNNSIKTGFNEIDLVLSGIDRGSLIIVGGHTSMGKTSFMMNILENLLNYNHICMYISLELNKKMFLQKLLAHLTEIPLHKFLQNNLEKSNIKTIKNKLEKFANFDLYFTDGYFQLDLLEEKIKKIKPKYVFIDYLQLININSRNARNEEVKKLYLTLKLLHKKLAQLFL